MNKRMYRSMVLVVLASVILLSCASARAAGAYEPARVGRGYETAPDSGERMVAYTANIKIETADPASARTELLARTKNTGGFLTLDTDDSLTVRIPAERFDDFMQGVKSLGTVKSEQITGRDITESYSNDVIHLESLKKIRDRYEEFLSRAETIADMLAIERELDRINLQIDQVEKRKQSAELSVEYASITIHFGKEAKPGPIGWIFYGLYRGIKWLFVWN